MLRPVCDTADDTKQDVFCTPNALSSVLTACRGCSDSSRDASIAQQQRQHGHSSSVKARLHVSQVIYHISKVLLGM